MGDEGAHIIDGVPRTVPAELEGDDHARERLWEGAFKIDKDPLCETGVQRLSEEVPGQGAIEGVLVRGTQV